MSIHVHAHVPGTHISHTPHMCTHIHVHAHTTNTHAHHTTQVHVCTHNTHVHTLMPACTFTCTCTGAQLRHTNTQLHAHTQHRRRSFINVPTQRNMCTHTASHIETQEHAWEHRDRRMAQEGHEWLIFIRGDGLKIEGSTHTPDSLLHRPAWVKQLQLTCTPAPAIPACLHRDKATGRDAAPVPSHVCSPPSDLRAKACRAAHKHLHVRNRALGCAEVPLRPTSFRPHETVTGVAGSLLHTLTSPAATWQARGVSRLQEWPRPPGIPGPSRVSLLWWPVTSSPSSLSLRYH